MIKFIFSKNTNSFLKTSPIFAIIYFFVNTLTIDTFQKEIYALIGEAENANCLIAVSSGVDSMVLLWLFKEIRKLTRWTIHAAHINYKLRGMDSEKDQQLVQEFCSKERIPLHTYVVSEKDQKPKGSIQLWARELRYHFFRDVQKKEKLNILVTAHHLNDQLETFLINLSRGSGISGLTGIPINENGILRPLLSFSKETIYNFARQQNIPFREDYSNRKNDYQRNRFRNLLIPELIKLEPHFLENFSKSLHLLKQAKEFISAETKKQREQNLKKNEEGYLVLHKPSLAKQPALLQFEILKPYGFNHEKEISKIFKAQTGKIFHSTHYELLVNRASLVIKPKNPETTYPKSTENQTRSRQTWFFDPDKINLPLKTRARQPGDLIFPIGMTGKKKISKLLKDEKISQWDKENIQVLCDAHDRILGVLPLRQDRRFVGDASGVAYTFYTVKTKKE